MFTSIQTFRSPAILSVRVRTLSAPPVLVITADPAIVGAVSEFLRSSRGDSTPAVWMPTLASARRRLAHERAALIVIDDTGASAVATLASLRQLAPDTRIIVLSETAARS